MTKKTLRVGLRVRPLLQHEKELTWITFVKDEPKIHINKDKSFTFDFVHPPSATQQDLFDKTMLPLLSCFLEGNNISILAYGQTGSGKSYSLGTSSKSILESIHQGMIPRFMKSLFEKIKEIKSGYQIFISFFEIFNQDIIDLLRETDSIQSIPTLKEERIYSVNGLLNSLQQGSYKRTSNSHVVFSIQLKRQSDHDLSLELISKFQFIELSGFEKVIDMNYNETKSNGKIVLNNIISMFENDSILKTENDPLSTLLQDSLVENSHMLLLACICPTSNETDVLHILTYVDRIRHIQNGNIEPIVSETQQLKAQLERLRLQINLLKDVSRQPVLEKEIQSMRAELDHLKSYTAHLSQELASTQTERDSLLFKQPNLSLHPMMEHYAAELQNLKLELMETKNQLALYRPPPIYGSKSTGVSRSSRKLTASLSSGRRQAKKKPIFYRTKAQFSPSVSHKKKSTHHQHMLELLDLLNEEIYLDNKIMSRDVEDQSSEESTSHELETNIDLKDDTLISPTTTTDSIQFPQNEFLDDDELEALAVPSWNHIPKAPTSNAGSVKRLSISVDSLWDDTDSSLTAPNKPFIQTKIRPSYSKDTKKTKNLVKMLHQVQADLLVKRELVNQLEKTEGHYTQMRSNYEERLNEMKSYLFEVQEQRDAAIDQQQLKRITIVESPTLKRPASVLELRENRQAQEVRSQFEVKMKRLSTENAELKKKNEEANQELQEARLKSEATILKLRQEIEALKLDKKKQAKQLRQEQDKARETGIVQQREIEQLKRRIAVVLDSKKKLETANASQAQVIKKRTDETAATLLQIKHLTNALRRAATEGCFLNEVTFEKILSNANSRASTPMNRK